MALLYAIPRPDGQPQAMRCSTMRQTAALADRSRPTLVGQRTDSAKGPGYLRCSRGATTADIVFRGDTSRLIANAAYTAQA